MLATITKRACVLIKQLVLLAFLGEISGCGTNYVSKEEGEKSSVTFLTKNNATSVYLSNKKQQCFDSTAWYESIWGAHHVHQLPRIRPDLKNEGKSNIFFDVFSAHAEVLVGEEVRFYMEAPTGIFYGYGHEICGLMVGFFPEAGNQYEVTYTAKPGTCNVVISEVSPSGRRFLLEQERLWYPSCKSIK